MESAATPPTNPSPVEAIKAQSRQLRGSLAEELASPADHLSDSAKNLLKFHGSYQQEDRDARKRRGKEGVGKHYMFMVRCKIPGGKLTAAQYLVLDQIAEHFGNGTLRLTTRQSVQLHGVLKDHLRPTIAAINASLLSTLGACGDVNRNVMCCPAPLADGIRPVLQQCADTLAAHLAPRTTAYHEIWLNGQAIEPGPLVDEPIYGATYLPRKFKIGFALPEDNCVDVHAQDLGFLAAIEHGQVVGFDLLAGGGMGMSHGNRRTFPHLAQPIGAITLDQLVPAAEAVITLFRDHGNRSDRKRARLKYLVADWGVERFREVLAAYLPFPLPQPRGLRVQQVDLHLGWHDQGDGRGFFGLSIENGRIKDDESGRLRSGLNAIVREFQPTLRITPQQDLLLGDLPADARPALERRLDEFGIPRPDQVSPTRQLAMACPAIPTCGLAISESERALPRLIDQLDAELRQLGLDQTGISVRMTGCPNGCARPYQSEIGIVGRSGNKYMIYLAGHSRGDRLNLEWRDLVPFEQIVPSLRPLLAHYRAERRAREGFGDFCARVGITQLRAWSEE